MFAPRRQNLPFLWARPTPSPFIGRQLLAVLPGIAVCHHFTMAAESVAEANAAALSQSSASETEGILCGAVSAAAVPVAPSIAAAGAAQSVYHGDVPEPPDTDAQSSPHKGGNVDAALAAPASGAGSGAAAAQSSNTSLAATGGQCAK